MSTLPATREGPGISVAGDSKKLRALETFALLKGEPFVVGIGGKEQQVAHTGPRYSARYEIDGPHVLVGAGWAHAVEFGRWPSEVRPYTRNRHHALYQIG